MKKTITALILILALLFSMVACAKTQSPGAKPSNSSAPAASAAPSAPAAPAKKETKFLSYGSFQSGTFPYMYAAAFCGLVREQVPYLNITNEATSGSGENLDLLYRKEAAFGTATPDRPFNAYNGTGAYKDKGKLNVGIMWTYGFQAALLFVKANSGINGFNGLAGKKVCIGSAGSSNEFKNSFILEAYGYTRKEPGKFQFNELQTFSIDYNEGANALADGTVDAILMTQAVPEPPVYELAMTTPLKIFGVDKDKYEKVKKDCPFMWEVSVPANSYPGQKEPISTLCEPTYLIASPDLLSEEDAYNLTKAYVEKILPKISAQFDSQKQFGSDPSLLTSSWAIPGHPGSVKYFKEKGFDVSVKK